MRTRLQPAPSRLRAEVVMANDTAALLAELTSRGMSEEEAENFLNNKVGYVKLQLPPEVAAKVFTELSKLSLVSQPVEVTFAVAANRIQTLGDKAQEASGRPLLNAMIPKGALVC